uniref:Uncharacterized protein n=1 Tax=Solanum bulbocastanum TaxID=147425 RepID=Q7XA37_SOLBU|nr:hypothetical protein SBB1_14t00001 [Solanum bulbocastanum]
MVTERVLQFLILRRYATLRSKEAVTVIEKQTQALFGRPDIKVSGDGTLDVSNDEVLSVTYSGLTMLKMLVSSVVLAICENAVLSVNHVQSRKPRLGMGPNPELIDCQWLFELLPEQERVARAGQGTEGTWLSNSQI